MGLMMVPGPKKTSEPPVTCFSTRLKLMRASPRAHPVVVDDERRFLLPDKSEDNGIPMNDSQFIIDKEVLSYLSQMRFEDCPHP